MANYDFHALLEPMEFERFACDIIQVREGVTVETFKEGRDDGIDGLFIDNKGRKVIVQVKRYAPTNYKMLYKKLKEELPKIKKLNLDRYILAVTMDFTPRQKEEIISLYKDYIKDRRDILTNNYINGLLQEPLYRKVELDYPNLWLSSMNVLQQTISKSVHSSIYLEAELEFKNALSASKRFVPTKKYHEAIEKLMNNNVIILSGEPGVGKTTLAYLLALAFIDHSNLKGFVWANSLADIKKMMDYEGKQVFIMDDFWGSIFQDEYRYRNRNNELDTLINYFTQSNGDKKLILTTREYVLQQGLQRLPLLKETLKQFSLVCMVEEYSIEERANIYYKHLYFTDLPYDYVDYMFYQSREVVINSNYNPRVLGLFLENSKLSSEDSPQSYYEDFHFYLENPKTFWEDVFNELSDEAKIVSLILLISSTSVRYSDMEKCYNTFVEKASNPTKIKKLQDCIAELEKTMLKSFYDEEWEEVLLKFSTPAVQDFLYDFLKENSSQYVPLILECTHFYNQLLFLLEHVSGVSTESVENSISESCIKYYDYYSDSFLDDDYTSRFDVFDMMDQYGVLNRLFHLIRCSGVLRRSLLFEFIEGKITNYCITMGSEDSIQDQYHDLQNLPDIISRCVEKGMFFNGLTIIEKYYEEAFSIYHHSSFKEFKKIFPQEYNSFEASCPEIIKQDIEQVVLLEIDLLEEYEMDFELDILLDRIPDTLKEFGFQYTIDFEERIYEICGRKPYKYENTVASNKVSSHDDLDKEEKDFYTIMFQAREWLFGPSESDLEEVLMDEMVRESNLTESLKTKLLTVIETGSPHYLFDILNVDESHHLLIDALVEGGSILPKTEGEINMMMTAYICRDNMNIMHELIAFSAECFILFMNQDEAIVRSKEFFASDIYNVYLINNQELKQIVFDYLILDDGKWIVFKHVNLFIFCFTVFIAYENIYDKDISDDFLFLFEEGFAKYKKVTKTSHGHKESIFYADYGYYPLKNYEWEGSLCRLLAELTPNHFCENYVYPKLKDYLNKFVGVDLKGKTEKYLEDVRLSYTFKEDGELNGSSMKLDAVHCMIEHLNIAELPCNLSINDYIEIEKLEEWENQGLLVKNYNAELELKLYEVKDFNVIRELELDKQVKEFLNKIEKVVYSRKLTSL